MTTRVDIVIPVYNAPEDVRVCIESVLRHTDARHTITLIDDASPDPRIAELFTELAARALPQISLLANPANLGFTGTANRGMSLSRADVVLLNSDTIVSPGWLDAMLRCAESDPTIGTITPFSNNAEILSFPHFCLNNPWAGDADPSPVAAALARAAVPSYPELPTGVGFCFYIRRALINDIGQFDPAYGAGYGEENDFCLRAAAHGWRNVLADDAFVVHTGGRSFTTQKAALVPKNTATLLSRHPGFSEVVQRYVAADPLRSIRESARTQLGVMRTPGAGVLHVIHHHGGGTESHVRALIDASRQARRHFLAVAVGDEWQVEEHREDGTCVTYALARRCDERWPAFVGALCATFGIGLVHLHNISACRDGILEAMAVLDLPFGYTVHDVNFGCPTITFLDASGRFCGGVTDAATCRRCLAAQPLFAGIDIVDWRERHRALIARAAFVIAPSAWAADMFARYFDCRPTVIPHGTHVQATGAMRQGPTLPLKQEPIVGDSENDRGGNRSDGSASGNGDVNVLPLPHDDAKVVAVLGAVGPDKGARTLERLVEIARARGAKVRFVLIGYLDRRHGPWQSSDKTFTVHGRYRTEALPQLLREYDVDLVLYPSAGPETFCFTLSEAWAAGQPVLVPPIGALAERVHASGAGSIMTETEWNDDAAMFARLESLLTGAEVSQRQDAARRALALPLRTSAAMVQATLALYDVAAARESKANMRGLDNARVRDALGYTPWHPSPPSNATIAARRSLRSHLARVAMRMRRTAIGATLYRRMSPRLIDALKSRLR
jgi:GT2 family glycosyltransferase/glycosyltransferase involved in cell wall biosynthesis